MQGAVFLNLLILEREKGRRRETEGEREREREKHQFFGSTYLCIYLLLLICALTRD